MNEALGIWLNPYQRFGFIVANVLIGDGIEPHDRDLFFGPLHPHDPFVEMPEQSRLDQVMARLGIFESAKDAARRGYGGPVARGFTDILNIGKARHRVTILKVTA